MLLVFAGMVIAAYLLLPQYTPDGRNYTPMTLEYLGYSPSEARAMTDAWFDAHGVSDKIIVPPDFTADLYAPRVLYPLLSVPFVAILGIPGMLVVPVLSLFAFVVLMTWLLARLFSDTAAVVVVGLTLLGSSFLLYSTAALTDSLAMALVAAICCVLPIRPDVSPRAPGWAAVLILALGFTRQITAVPTAMVLLACLSSMLSERRWRTTWTLYALGAVASFAASLVWVQISSGLGPARSITVITNSTDLSEALGKLPGTLRMVLSTELRSLLGERPLLVVAVAGVAFAIWRWRSPLAALIAGGLVATAALQVVNPYPTYGRIILPLLPTLMFGLAAMIAGSTRSHPAADRPSTHPAPVGRPPRPSPAASTTSSRPSSPSP